MDPDCLASLWIQTWLRTPPQERGGCLYKTSYITGSTTILLTCMGTSSFIQIQKCLNLNKQTSHVCHHTKGQNKSEGLKWSLGFTAMDSSTLATVIQETMRNVQGQTMAN